MGMRGKREAGSREEAGLPQGTEKEELHVTGSPIGSRILRKTESVRWTVLLRKAMNLNETEDAPSSERRILGGIGKSKIRFGIGTLSLSVIPVFFSFVIPAQAGIRKG